MLNVNRNFILSLANPGQAGKFMPQHKRVNKRYMSPANPITGQFTIGQYSGCINRNGGIIRIVSSDPQEDQYLLQQYAVGRDFRLLL